MQYRFVSRSLHTGIHNESTIRKLKILPVRFVSYKTLMTLIFTTIHLIITGNSKVKVFRWKWKALIIAIVHYTCISLIKWHLGKSLLEDKPTATHCLQNCRLNGTDHITDNTRSSEPPIFHLAIPRVPDIEDVGTMIPAVWLPGWTSLGPVM